LESYLPEREMPLPAEAFQVYLVVFFDNLPLIREIQEKGSFSVALPRRAHVWSDGRTPTPLLLKKVPPCSSGWFFSRRRFFRSKNGAGVFSE